MIECSYHKLLDQPSFFCVLKKTLLLYYLCSHTVHYNLVTADKKIPGAY